MKNSTLQKTLLLFFFFAIAFAGKVSAQLVSVTTTPATVCTPPGCDGTATSTDASALGGTYLWDDPMAQTTMVATGLCPGTYSVTISTSFGSMGASGVVGGCGAGVVDIVPAKSLSVYPNPATTSVSLDLSSIQQGNYTLTLVNVLGETISSEKISINGSMRKMIDVSIVPTGVYTVELRSDKNFYAGKVFKQ